jgi:EAL domain-containing protein (putative c-di-GMP-specific phosphodiesterase class I)/GGDEF domain-containing protein
MQTHVEAHPHRTLFLSASGEHARMVEHALGGLRGWEWARVCTVTEARALLRTESFQALIADAACLDLDAVAMERLRLAAPELPMLLIGDGLGSQTACEDAWLDWARFSRPKLGALLGALAGWEAWAPSSAERRYDESTGLPCGDLFMDQGRQMFSLARRQRGPLALLLLRQDADADAGGGPGGHVVWQREAVLALRHGLRDTDNPGLLGDGELAVFLPGLGRPEEVVAVGQRLLERLRQLRRNRGQGPLLSVGAAFMPQAGGGAEELVQAGRLAAQRSLALGGDCLHFDDPELDQAAASRFRYEVDLRCGLLAGQFTLHYQPQASLDGKAKGVEALLRWLHPTRGPVPPSEFIPFSEACGFIDPLSAWALRRALRASCDLEAKIPGLKMSVNLSPRQFHDPDLVDSILDALRQEGCPGSRLCVEVTESSALVDVERAAATLAKLRNAGVTVALDDFGSGYASVGYLKQLPLDYVKLDRSLVQELGRRKDDERIAELVVTIAHQQKLLVIAEGVEEETQLAALKRIGCDQYQGYYLAKPQPLEQLETWLSARTPAKRLWSMRF